ncbi:hypothetical protein D3C81_1760540 [compost metagenome]
MGIAELKHVLELRYRESPLDKRQLAVQVTLGQVPKQRMRFRMPRAEQAMDTEEALLARFLPKFTENAQTSVAAVADDEMRLIGAAGDGGRLIQAALAN